MLFAVAALPASAHEFWIAPSRYAATPGAPIELAAVAGTGFRGERKPWSPDRSVRFVLETARTVDLTRAASPGDIVWTRFAPSDPGGAMVAFESSFLPIELPPAQFDAYLADEGLDGPLTSRRSPGGAVPGRERYRRCAKLWLAGLDGARATRPLGLPLELVPAGVPGAEPRLTLRVLADGAPLAGAMVKAWRAPFGSDGTPRAVAERDSVAAVWRGRSDARGEVAIPVAEAGEWLVSAVRMVPSRDRSAADWESTWASLTFARMGPAPASRAAAVRSGATRPAAAGRAARGTGALPGGRPSAGAP